MLISKLFKRKKRIIERRRHSRKHLRNLLSVESSERSLFNLSDISEGGLQFKSPRRFTQNKILNLTVNLAQAGTQIQVLGKVAWSRGACRLGSRVYQIGVVFQELSREAAQAIALARRSLRRTS